MGTDVVTAGRVVAAATLAVVLGAVALGPFEVVGGIARLAGWTLLTAGASVLVVRCGAVDLATPAAIAAGAYAGGVLAGIAALPAPVGLATGVLAGTMMGAATAAMAGRVGGRLAALPTLSVTLAVQAGMRAWPTVGGAAGYHAVPFLTGSDRGDAVAVTLLAAAALGLAAAFAGRPAAARASVAVHAPPVAAALGHRPAVVSAVAGAVGGALLGAGGTVQAMVSGSVQPGGYGLGLAAAVALAALVGGAAPWGPLVGALWVWGPSVVFPLTPVVGDAPPLLVTGAAGLAVLAWRRGRPLVAGGPVPPALATSRPPDRAPATDVPVLTVAAGPGPSPALTVHAGEVVAIVGPNGAGKSTLLARIGGQLPDGGRTRFAGRRAPASPVARARAGLGRTWQRPPDVPAADLVAAAPSSPHAAAVTAAVTAVAPSAPTEAPADELRPAVAQLVAAAAVGDRVLLLDEPATTLPETAVARAVRAIADAGVAVVLVDHRPAVLAAADRIVPFGEEAAP